VNKERVERRRGCEEGEGGKKERKVRRSGWKKEWQYIQRADR